MTSKFNYVVCSIEESSDVTTLIDGRNRKVHQIVAINKVVSLSFSTGIIVQLSN